MSDPSEGLTVEHKHLPEDQANLTECKICSEHYHRLIQAVLDGLMAEQAADDLGVSTITLKRWMRGENLPHQALFAGIIREAVGWRAERDAANARAQELREQLDGPCVDVETELQMANARIAELERQIEEWRANDIVIEGMLTKEQAVAAFKVSIEYETIELERFLKEIGAKERE